jgi:hypothetical protein
MKPQRPQRRTLCPQKDLLIRKISERQGAWRKSVKNKVIFLNSLKINLFSVPSVVGF